MGFLLLLQITLSQMKLGSAKQASYIHDLHPTLEPCAKKYVSRSLSKILWPDNCLSICLSPTILTIQPHATKNLFSWGHGPWKIHGNGLKLSQTDKHGFHFYVSAPHPGFYDTVLINVHIASSWLFWKEIQLRFKLVAGLARLWEKIISGKYFSMCALVECVLQIHLQLWMVQNVRQCGPRHTKRS